MPRSPLEQAADLAVGEMLRRLQDNPRSLPDHVLGKLLNDINKLIDRRDEEDEEARSTPLLEQLAGLPKTRAIELLKVEVARLEQDYILHKNVLEELRK